MRLVGAGATPGGRRRAACALVVLAGWLASCGQEEPRAQDAPAPPASSHGASVDSAAKACARCHPHESEAWAVSAHALQGTPRQQPPGGASAAIGSRWMQAYMRQDDSGLNRIVPVCYDLRDGVWRDVPAVLVEIGGVGEGNLKHPQLDLARRSFDLDCSGCHASGTHLAYDTLRERFATGWRSLAIDCAACHGATPGHGEGGLGRAAALGSLSPRARTMVCGRCHGGPAVEGDLEPSDAAAFVGFLGERSGLYADGTPAGQIYQLGTFLRSPCHLEGGLTCTGCHDPHGPGHRVEGHTDALCVTCHDGYASPAHTHHAPASDGARCIECHMPRLLGGLMHHQRDHRIGVPLPALPQVPDACTACHADRDEAWADAAWRGWWGDPPRARLEATQVVAAARRGESAAPELRRALTHRDPFFRAAALAYLPEAAELLVADPLPELRLSAVRVLEARREAGPLLERYAQDAHPLVRASALLALSARGEPIPAAHRPDIALLARLNRGEVDARRALVRWALEASRWAEAKRLLESWLALRLTEPEPWFLLAELCHEQADTAGLSAAALHGVQAAFSSAEASAQGVRVVEAVAGASVQRSRRALGVAVLRAAAEHAPDAELRGHFGRLLERLRRSP